MRYFLLDKTTKITQMSFCNLTEKQKPWKP